MKRIIMIVGIMMLIAGGGLAGLMVLEIIPNPFASSDEEAAEGEGNGEGGPPSFVPPERAPILYPLEDLVVPVIIDGRVVKRVYITARLQVVPGNLTAVVNGLPRMESALNENLITYLQDHFAKNRRLDPRGIKRVMVEAGEKVYGELIADVLLITIFEQ